MMVDIAEYWFDLNQQPLNKCQIMNEDTKKCIGDLAKLYIVDYDQRENECLKNQINEWYALGQSADLTINMIVALVIFCKLCMIHFDCSQENKLIFRQHLAMLLWSITHTTLIATQFFLNPNHQYDMYIRTLGHDGSLLNDDYKTSTRNRFMQVARSIENYLLLLIMTIKLYEWLEIKALISVQRNYQN